MYFCTSLVRLRDESQSGLPPKLAPSVVALTWFQPPGPSKRRDEVMCHSYMVQDTIRTLSWFSWLCGGQIHSKSQSLEVDFNSDLVPEFSLSPKHCEWLGNRLKLAGSFLELSASPRSHSQLTCPAYGLPVSRVGRSRKRTKENEKGKVMLSISLALIPVGFLLISC